MFVVGPAGFHAFTSTFEAGDLISPLQSAGNNSKADGQICETGAIIYTKGVKFTLEHAMKSHTRSGGIAVLFL